MDEYALSHGHQPTENWILIVHADNSTEFYTFDDPSSMWCCEYKGILRTQIMDEVRKLDSGIVVAAE